MMIQAPDRPVRLASTSGHALTLEAGERRELGGVLVMLALQAGCMAVTDGAPAPPQPEAKVEAEPEPEPQETPDGFEETDPDVPEVVVSKDPTERRHQQITAAIRELIARNDPETLTTSGMPRVRDVAVVLGYSVTRFEVERVFQSMDAGD